MTQKKLLSPVKIQLIYNNHEKKSISVEKKKKAATV